MKTEQTFTPGGWFTQRLPHSIEIRFGGSIDLLAPSGIIATISDYSSGIQGVTPEMGANSSLIAAAPDLLEALKLCQVRLFMLDGTSEEYKLAEAAIAKATGSKP